MITFKHSGSFRRIEAFLNGTKRINVRGILEKYGREGVSALESSTPKDTGITANSWNYKVGITGRGYSLEWTNSNTTVSGTPIVILLQYGHGTGTGGYVQGRDFINPAIKPIFDKIASDLFKEVTIL